MHGPRSYAAGMSPCALNGFARYATSPAGSFSSVTEVLDWPTRYSDVLYNSIHRDENPTIYAIFQPWPFNALNFLLDVEVLGSREHLSPPREGNFFRLAQVKIGWGAGERRLARVAFAALVAVGGDQI